MYLYSMRFIAALSLVVSLFLGCKRETLTMQGSETMYPMLKILEEDYNLYQDDVRVVVGGGGSLKGLRQLVSGTIDIAASSLEIEEALSSQLAQIDTYDVVVLAYDGISIVINRNNPVERLHLRQISDMFAGKISNWKEVGGPDMKVLPVVRNDNSGTAAYMKRHVLRQFDLGDLVFEKYRDREYGASARTAANNREIADIVSKHVNAISYMGMGSAETEGRGRVKKISYAVNARGPYVLPGPAEVESRRYQLSRPLMLVYRRDKDAKKKDFIEYVKSGRAHAKIKSSGYLDILQTNIMMKTLTIKGD